MFVIKRIIIVTLSVIGSLASIVLLALINSLSHIGLTGGQVVLYGLITGVATGIFAGYLTAYFLIKKARKFIYNKLINVVSRFGSLKKV